MRSPLIRSLAGHPALQEPMRRLVRGALSWGLRRRARAFALGREGPLLAIAPHPDDACLGCGGLILQRRLEGLPVSVIYLTEGGASHPGHPRLAPQMLMQTRRQEAFLELTRLGVDRACVHFAGLADGRLDKLEGAEREAAILTVRGLIERARPAQVLLPSRHDGSTEHEGAFQLVRAAALGANVPLQILEYPVWAWWSPLRLWRPLLGARRIWRVDLRGYEAVKRLALSAHVTQMEPTPPWTKPVLPDGFARCFCAGEEFLFEMEPSCAAS